MADKKFFKGKVATKITEDMVGKALLRVTGVSILPEFKRDADGKLERDENGKAIVDTEKEIVVFNDNKATFRTKINFTKSQLKVAFNETATEATDVYVNVEANKEVAEGLKRATDKDVLKTDTPLSLLLICEKDGNTYKAELLDFEFASYRKFSYHCDWARTVTETIVGRVVARLNYVTFVPEFKRDASGNLERDENGKAIVDATRPLINFEGDGVDAKAKFRLSPYLAKSVATQFFGDDTLEEGKLYMSVTAFGYTAMNMKRANDANPFDISTEFNFDLFTKKNDRYFNGQVLGFNKLPARNNESTESDESVGADIMNEATEVTEGDTLPEGEEMEFPF